ncbi:adaptin amino-terminal region protein [Ceratobasidium sp. AG-Ba]|nr:adaptin amino-terminal region protein [Ceratobasidium sp. AG-Ba]
MICLDRYWPDASKIDEERVHLLLNVTAVRPIGPKRPQDDLADLPSTFRNMQLQQNNTAKWFQNCKPPSETARPSTYMEQQNGKVAPILNGRPYACTGLPVQLFHPVFDHFLRALEASDEPSASDYKNVQMLAFTGQDVYRNEGDRWKLLLSRFLVALDSKIARDHPVQNCKPDGLIQFFSTERLRPRDSGSGGLWNLLEPGRRFIDPRELLLSVSLIAVAGPWMCILGAVYLDHVVVQQLTDYVWLGHHPQQEIHLRRLTRLFCAARDSIVQLSNYYASISGTPPRPPDRERFFPHVRQYSTPGGGVIAFSYTGFIDTPTKPVFTAVTESGKDIVVKFAERYNIEAHRTLADKALAPAILSYEPPTHSRGFHCIIMERVNPCLFIGDGDNMVGLDDDDDYPFHRLLDELPDDFNHQYDFVYNFGEDLDHAVLDNPDDAIFDEDFGLPADDAMPEVDPPRFQIPRDGLDPRSYKSWWQSQQ